MLNTKKGRPVVRKASKPPIAIIRMNRNNIAEAMHAIEQCRNMHVPFKLEMEEI